MLPLVLLLILLGLLQLHLLLLLLLLWLLLLLLLLWVSHWLRPCTARDKLLGVGIEPRLRGAWCSR